MPTSEAGLVAAIVRAVRKEYPDAWVFKTVGNPYQMAGVPDLLLSVHGLLVGLEVKHQHIGESVEHARERATPQQRYHVKRINDSGAIARVVVSVEEALDAIQQATTKQERNR